MKSINSCLLSSDRTDTLATVVCCVLYVGTPYPHTVTSMVVRAINNRPHQFEPPRTTHPQRCFTAGKWLLRHFRG
jgi:hypothetical protein